MNRRLFLCTAGIFAASSVLPRNINGEERKIRTGFLGVGHSHAAGKIRVVQANSDLEFVGVWAETPALQSRFEREGIPILSREAVIEKSDLVVVESEVRDLARLAKLALEAGRHVHIEKPPAPDLDQFRELQALARKKARLLQVGYMWRFNPGLMKALEAARNGWLGSVYLVRGTMNTWLAPERRPEWGEFKGGATFEQGCHLIDPLVRLLGRPRHVTPFLKSHGGLDDGLADNCVVVFEFERATGIITNSTLHPNAGPQRFFEILGTNGTAMVKPLEPPALELHLARAGGPYEQGRNSIELPPYQRYVDEFAELARCIPENGPLAVSPEEELLVHETVLRASGMF